jgi:uncharacterized membrane protein YciS (DUF1049 family)
MWERKVIEKGRLPDNEEKVENIEKVCNALGYVVTFLISGRLYTSLRVSIQRL